MPPNTRGKGHANVDDGGGSGNPSLVSEQVIGPTNTVEVPVNPRPQLPSSDSTRSRLDHEIEGLGRTLEHRLITIIDTRFADQNQRLDNKMDRLEARFSELQAQIVKLRQTPPPFIPPVFGNVQASTSMFDAPNPNLYIGDDGGPSRDTPRGEYQPRHQGRYDPVLPFPLNPEVDIPTFSGDEDVLGWLYQLEHHFDIQQTAEWDKISFSKYYLREQALLWWRWIEGRGLSPVDWNEFKEKMVLEYGPNELDDPLAALSKLRQLAGVADFYRDFIKIGHLVKGLDGDHLVSLFLAGLEPEIRLEVKLSKPQSVSSAFRLACAREEIIQLRRRPPPTRPPFVRAPTAPPPRTIVPGADANQGWL